MSGRPCGGEGSEGRMWALRALQFLSEDRDQCWVRTVTDTRMVLVVAAVSVVTSGKQEEIGVEAGGPVREILRKLRVPSFGTHWSTVLEQARGAGDHSSGGRALSLDALCGMFGSVVAGPCASLVDTMRQELIEVVLPALGDAGGDPHLHAAALRLLGNVVSRRSKDGDDKENHWSSCCAAKAAPLIVPASESVFRRGTLEDADSARIAVTALLESPCMPDGFGKSLVPVALAVARSGDLCFERRHCGAILLTVLASLDEVPAAELQREAFHQMHDALSAWVETWDDESAERVPERRDEGSWAGFIERASEALGYFVFQTDGGKATASQLREWLGFPAWNSRAAAVLICASLSSPVRALLRDELLSMAHNEVDSRVRYVVLEVLDRQVRDEIEEAVRPALVRLSVAGLSDSDPRVREASSHLLQSLETLSPSVIHSDRNTSFTRYLIHLLRESPAQAKFRDSISAILVSLFERNVGDEATRAPPLIAMAWDGGLPLETRSIFLAACCALHHGPGQPLVLRGRTCQDVMTLLRALLSLKRPDAIALQTLAAFVHPNTIAFQGSLAERCLLPLVLHVAADTTEVCKKRTAALEIMRQLVQGFVGEAEAVADVVRDVFEVALSVMAEESRPLVEPVSCLIHSCFNCDSAEDPRCPRKMLDWVSSVLGPPPSPTRMWRALTMVEKYLIVSDVDRSEFVCSGILLVLKSVLYWLEQRDAQPLAPPDGFQEELEGYVDDWDQDEELWFTVQNIVVIAMTRCSQYLVEDAEIHQLLDALLWRLLNPKRPTEARLCHGVALLTAVHWPCEAGKGLVFRHFPRVIQLLRCSNITVVREAYQCLEAAAEQNGEGLEKHVVEIFDVLVSLIANSDDDEFLAEKRENVVVLLEYLLSGSIGAQLLIQALPQRESLLPLKSPDKDFCRRIHELICTALDRGRETVLAMLPGDKGEIVRLLGVLVARKGLLPRSYKSAAQRFLALFSEEHDTSQKGCCLQNKRKRPS